MKGTFETWSTPPQSADEEKLVQWNEQGTEPEDLGCLNLISATNVINNLKARFTFLGPLLHIGERDELDFVYISLSHLSLIKIL